jgi:hypothetical protein
MSHPAGDAAAAQEGSEEWTGPVADSGESLPVLARHSRFEG